MALLSVIAFVVGTVIAVALGVAAGTAAIYVAASVVVDVEDLSRAFWTALIGAVALWAASLLFGWIPILGLVIALLCWIWVINSQYPGGLTTAATIGFVAWFVAVAVTIVAGVVGLPVWTTGVPGV